MFKQIILAFSPKITLEKQQQFLSQMEKESGIQIVFLHDFADIYQYDAKESLVLTDKREVLHAAYSRELAHIAYLHEGNAIDGFPFTPYAITSLDGLPFSYLENVYKRFWHIPWEILTTERCKLREITVDDVDELYEIYSDGNITRYMEGLFENREEEIEYTRQYIENMYGFYGFGMWIVERLSDGKILGRAGLNIRDGYEDFELGYVIRSDEQGKGYATEICLAIMDYAAHELDAVALNAFIHPENAPSVRLCERLGFHRMGRVDIEGTLLDRYQIFLADN